MSSVINHLLPLPFFFPWYIKILNSVLSSDGNEELLRPPSSWSRNLSLLQILMFSVLAVWSIRHSEFGASKKLRETFTHLLLPVNYKGYAKQYRWTARWRGTGWGMWERDTELPASLRECHSPDISVCSSTHQFSKLQSFGLCVEASLPRHDWLNHRLSLIDSTPALLSCSPKVRACDLKFQPSNHVVGSPILKLPRGFSKVTLLIEQKAPWSLSSLRKFQGFRSSVPQMGTKTKYIRIYYKSQYHR